MEILSMLISKNKGDQNNKLQMSGPEGHIGHLAFASHVTEVFHSMLQK